MITIKEMVLKVNLKKTLKFHLQLFFFDLCGDFLLQEASTAHWLDATLKDAMFRLPLRCGSRWSRDRCEPR